MPSPGLPHGAADTQTMLVQPPLPCWQMQPSVCHDPASPRCRPVENSFYRKRELHVVEGVIPPHMLCPYAHLLSYLPARPTTLFLASIASWGCPLLQTRGLPDGPRDGLSFHSCLLPRQPSIDGWLQGLF